MLNLISNKATKVITGAILTLASMSLLIFGANSIKKYVSKHHSTNRITNKVDKNINNVDSLASAGSRDRDSVYTSEANGSTSQSDIGSETFTRGSLDNFITSPSDGKQSKDESNISSFIKELENAVSAKEGKVFDSDYVSNARR